MKEQLATLIEKGREKELINLLRSLSHEERRKLAPEIKKLQKLHEGIEKNMLGGFQQRASVKQHQLRVMAGFVCYTLAEFQKEPKAIWIFDSAVFNKVVDWYMPDWFSDFVNKTAEGNFFFSWYNYEKIMDMSDKGWVQPGPTLIARTLPYLISENRPTSSDRANTVFTPEKLLKWPVTLREHIWHLFEQETVIDSIRGARFDAPENEKAAKSWMAVFKKFSEEGRIDRSRLLKEALLATNKNFNKGLSSWFADLFLLLNPTDNELIGLQQILFSVLSSPQSKPVSAALQIIKKIVVNKDFDAGGFVNSIPVLLSSKTKTTVASTLMILEKLAKKEPSLRNTICSAVTQVFMQADDELQLRAAKIINACRKDLDASFSREIAVFESSLMSSARNLLQDLLAPAVAAENEMPIEEPASSGGNNEWTYIPTVDNFDDFIFLSSQLVDNNHSWMIDVLPATILKFRKELKGENISKLEPALQRALKMMRGDMRSNQGWFDHMLATFFIDVCVYLVNKYFDDAESLRNLFHKYDQNLSGNRARIWLNIDPGKSYIEDWKPFSEGKLYRPYRLLLTAALNMLRRDIDCPLLSTPTHEPAWVESSALVRRLALWQQKGIEPESIDWQIAVSRCLLHDTAEAIRLAEELLTGEKLNLLLFLFGEHREPAGPISNAQVWMAASVALKEKKKYTALESFSFYSKPFGYYTGQHAWRIETTNFTQNRWNHTKRAYVKESVAMKTLNLITAIPEPPGEKTNGDKGGFLTRLFSRSSSGLKKIASAVLKDDDPLLYDFLQVKSTFLHVHANDIRRLLLLTPNNPEPLLACITATNLKLSGFGGESDKKQVIVALQLLHDTWSNAGTMAHLFLSACMIAGDKTVQQIAGEIWLNGISNGTVDNALVGKIIGQHQTVEFAPMKRLTDLMMLQLFRISPQHNKALQSFIENILGELPESPVKGLKKLLEIYAELLVANKSEPAADIADKLNQWKKAK